MAKILDYEVLEIISESYKKVIYKCKDTVTSEYVILKVLKGEFSDYEDVLRFKREYRIISDLCKKIDGIAKPIKLIEDNGTIIIVLEYETGESIKKTISDQNGDTEALLNLAIKIIDILGKIHENDIIHKDLKPSNIIWNKETNVVKIIDFDLAAELKSEKQHFQNTGILEGTIQYISPEQTGRINRSIDYRTDFYSFGVILYELFTGSSPYTADTLVDYVYSIIAKKINSPYEITNGRVSKQLSGIIMKLLSKAPENRYRSSYGIKADLKRCLNNESSFEIGCDDKLNVFQIPQKIYGREKELKTLKESFMKSIKDSSQILLVSGEAGSGKTSFVNELHRYVSEEKGFFIWGKYNQYNENIPYSAIIQAFRELILQISTSDIEYTNNISESLLSFLNKNGAIISGIIPEVEKLIGVQPQLPRMNPAEEANRFYATFINLIKGITQNKKPLVIFLDDLQWSDLSSIELIKKLALDNSLKNLLIVGSYRSNDISKSHSLFYAVKEIEKLKPVKEIFLDSISYRDVTELIKDTLHSNNKDTKELCDVIYGKTKGNCFYVNEILKDLNKKGFIYFDEVRGNWQWKTDEIKNLKISDNVVDFLILEMKKLSPEVQKVLSLCAVIGTTFQYKILALISEEDKFTIQNALLAGLKEDIISPLDRSHILLTDIMEDDYYLNKIDINFVFQHDRLQQALYQMIEEKTRCRLHLKIAQLLLKNLSKEQIEDKIVDIAIHMNKGIEYIEEEEEINNIIEVNLRAAKRVKASFGYSSAYEFLKVAKNLMTNKYWVNKFSLASEIYRLFAECGFLVHNLEEAENACNVLIKNTKNSSALAEIYEMKANYYMYLGMMNDSIEAGKAGLRCLGFVIPDKVSMISVGKELVKVKLALKGRTTEDIFASGEIMDEKIKLTMRLLVGFIPPAFISGQQNLFGVAVLKKVYLSLKYGNSPESAGAYIGYALLLSGMGDSKGAYDFGRLAVRINDKYDDLQWRSLVFVLYTLFCHFWNEPWDTLREWYQKAIESSQKSGDLLYLAHACYYINLWNPSLSIEEFLTENNKYIAMIENTKYKESLATAKLAKQKFLSISGELENPLCFDDESFSEKAFVEQIIDAKYYSGLAIYYIYKIQILFMYENYNKSLDYIEEAHKYISTLSGSAFMEEFSLYTYLNLIYCYNDLNIPEKLKAKKRIIKEYRRVKKWAKNCPENFMFHRYIMKAELCRISGKTEDAEVYYNLSIETAEKGTLLRYKALSNELAAKFYYNRGLKEISYHLFRQSYYYYSIWGAKGKANQLKEEYKDIWTKINGKVFSKETSITDSSSSIDINSIIMASEAILKEIELDSFLKALMEIVIKTALAQKGCIILRSNADIMVEGEYDSEKGEIFVLKHDEIVFYKFPKEIVEYVENNKEILIHYDTFSETTFVNDPYILKNRPKSVLCMPLINQNKVIAIIYLENNSIRGAFTKERVRIIDLLSREMVFSLENARLYTDLERSERELRAHRDKLEELVIERTKELEFKNIELNNYIEKVEQLSITDELTGLYNRRYFNETLERSIKESKERKEPLVFMMIDVDYFKKYNDTYGHYEGDNVLRKVGKLIMEYMKNENGYAFRLGGEEIGIFLYKSNENHAKQFAETIRRGVEELKIIHEKSISSGHVTISIGVSIISLNELTQKNIYTLADNALYTSKEKGRNCITIETKK